MSEEHVKLRKEYIKSVAALNNKTTAGNIAGLLAVSIDDMNNMPGSELEQIQEEILKENKGKFTVPVDTQKKTSEDDL